MRNFFRFHWLVFKHAFITSASQIKRVMPMLGLPEAGMWIVSFSIFTVIAGFSFLFQGNLNKAQDYLVSFGLGMAGLISIYTLLFAINLILAPSRLYQAQQENLTALSDQVNNKLSKKQIIQKLSDTLLIGWQILGERIEEDEFQVWKSKNQIWCQRAYDEVMTYFTPHDAVKIRTASGNTSQRYKYAVNNDHNTSLHFLKMRLEVLDNLIEGLK